MNPAARSLPALFATLFVAANLSAQTAPAVRDTQEDFFEKRIRPIFVSNCQMCHNAKAHTASLDLSSSSGFRAGGQSGPVIDPANPEASRLLRAVRYEESLKMPPMGKLKPEDIQNLTDWVKIGAPWPGAEPATPSAIVQPAAPGFTEEQKRFWAFQPVSKPSPPTPRELKWVRNEIDRFVLAKMEKAGLRPGARADKLTLLRRATYDLTGLPPTEKEISDFLADSSPGAFEKVVDRLLASPRYGERWGRHWLDVARYADSTGNDEDHRYPYAWRYRDYVIQAFNGDLPYDQFVREQIAGDLMPSGDGSQPNVRGIVATGFLALGPKAIAQPDKKKMLYDIYDEQVDVASRAVLGLTVACARCHNHKFDPILTKDYYAMVSIFASTRDFAKADSGVAELLYVPLVPKEQYAVYRADQRKISAVRSQIELIATEESERVVRRESGKLAAYMLAARPIYSGGDTVEIAAAESGLDPFLLARWAAYLKEGAKAHPQLADWDSAPPERRAEVAQAYQARFAKQFDGWVEVMNRWREKVRASLEDATALIPDQPEFAPAKDQFFYEVEFERAFSFSDRQREKILSPEARSQVAALRKRIEELRAHAAPAPDMACAVQEGEPVAQKVLIRGDYHNPGEDAPKSFPTILGKPDDPPFGPGSGRLELANWMASPRNPLTARVMVNRIWQWHFGDGLVRTPDNFGKMGDRPSHPELLDYLANRFIDSGWSVKTINRLIMLSNVYQTASIADEKTLAADPENRLLAHFPRQRLDAEEIRDGILALDGSIDLKMGGTLQTGFGTDSENSAGRLSMDPLKLTRRTVYLPLRRANLPTLLNLFDFGDATTVNGKRTLTNVAPQTLFMMNSEFGFEHARKLAAEFLAMTQATDAKRVEEAYLRILDRRPDAAEKDAALTYIGRFKSRYPQESGELGAWQSFCHVLLASNEFLYID